MLGFKRFFKARRVLSGVELVHKIIKGQFGLPESFSTDPFQVWYNVLAAQGNIFKASSTKEVQLFY
jgi:hypothetical protein